MDTNSVVHGLSFSDHAQARSELESETSIGDSIEVMPSCGDLMEEMESTGEILTRIELDLARSSEKSLNLENLSMYVAKREIHLETFVSESETEHSVGESATQGALEFDLLSGFFESELNELEHYLLNLQSKIELAYEMMSSSNCCEEAVMESKDKLSDSEKSLMQTLEQISDLRVQSNKFNRMLLISTGGKDGKVTKDMENDYFPDANSKIKLQTVEQRKHVLTMLEKSLARELDLEKKLTEAKQNEELLKHIQQQEVLCMEEEAEITWEKLFEAENSFEILLGMSKELMSKLQMLRFNYIGSMQRESELKSRCEDLNKQLMVMNSNVIDSQILIDVLKDKASKAEQRAENAENECRYLRETNTELNKDLIIVKNSEKTASEKSNLLEKKLRDSDIQLQHAVATNEASQEKQTMLQAVVVDMKTVITDLKSMVIRSERQTESVEEKCGILLESNSKSNEEVNNLRSRIETLEASLHQSEEKKKETVTDISVRTKLIIDLIMQLSSERERLHKQISLLTREKKILSERLLHRMTKDHSTGFKISRKGSTKLVHEVKGEATDLTLIRNERGMAENVTAGTVVSDSTSDGSLRNIDAGQLNRKYIAVAIGVLLLTVVAASLFGTSE